MHRIRRTLLLVACLTVAAAACGISVKSDDTARTSSTSAARAGTSRTTDAPTTVYVEPIAESTPTVCLDALDHADDLIDTVSDWITSDSDAWGTVSDLFTDLSAGDFSYLDVYAEDLAAHVDERTSYQDAILTSLAEYKIAADDCRDQ